MSMKPKSGARNKILHAADELARAVGPANLVLDAVAAKAGVSKGGLLYHFPSKLVLLQALIENHLERFRSEMSERMRQSGGGPDSVLRCYLQVFVAEHDQRMPPPSGVLAAMVQNPELLPLLKGFKREQLDLLSDNASDTSKALTLFLALEGLRSLKLFDFDILTEDESRQVIQTLSEMVSQLA